MKLKFLIGAFLLILGHTNSIGQVLSEKQAIQIANNLFDLEVLTQYGRDEMIAFIRRGNFERDMRRHPLTGSIAVRTDLLPSHLLQFLKIQFVTEQYYRGGVLDFNQIQNELLEGLPKGKPIDDSFYETVGKELERRRSELPHLFYEEKVQSEEKVLDTSRTFMLGGLMGGFLEKGGHIDPDRSVFGKTKNRTAIDLKKAGLYFKMVYQQLISDPEFSEALDELGVLYIVDRIIVNEEDYDSNIKVQKEYLDFLYQSGVLSATTYDLKKKEKKLLSKYEIAALCKFSIKVDVDDYTTGYQETIRHIFSVLEGFIPDLKIDSISCVLKVEDVDGELKRVDIAQDVVINGKNYIKVDFYDYLKPTEIDSFEQEKVHRLNVIPDGIHEVINIYLNSNGYEKRLFRINNSDKQYPMSAKECIYILLDESQKGLFGGDPYFISQAVFDNGLSFEGIKTMVDHLEISGLRTYTSASEKQSHIDYLTSQTFSEVPEVFIRATNLVVTFDWESANLENPYEEILLEFSKKSRGRFIVANIQDKFQEDWNNDSTKIGFELNGKSYQKTIEMNSDWLSFEFFELIEEAIADQGIDLGIYECYNDGQFGGYIMLNKSEFQYLKDNVAGLFEEY